MGVSISERTYAQDSLFYPVRVDSQALLVAPLEPDLLGEPFVPRLMGTVPLQSFEFMAATTIREGKAVDLISMVGEYDCSVTHRWRPVKQAGYLLGQTAAAFDKKGPGVWAVAAPESAGSALWGRACRPLPSEFQPLPSGPLTPAGRDAAVLDFRSIVDLL